MAADNLPPRTLPLLYLGTAHVSLALAFVFSGLWPQAVAGFFYHAWLIGLVHLITLGWISFSVVGAFYVVAPLALRLSMPVRRADYVAYGFAVIGLIGMVGHFWIQQYSGMAWSAGTIASGLLYLTARIAIRIQDARIPRAVKLHVALACVNFWFAATMGLLIACDKVEHFLPGFVLSNVFAHAHLAALGWAVMMVVGISYRMLPMWFPSKMPAGRSIYASAALLETGTIGLFVTLLGGSALTRLFGTVVVVGLIVFAAHVIWMLRHRVSKPVDARRPDFAHLHGAMAAASLGVSAALGITLLLNPTSPLMLHIAAAYGVLGLIGFLAQMIVAMEARLLPMVTWFWAYAASNHRMPPPSPHVMRDRSLQAIIFAGWTIGVPALAGGMFLESPRLVSIGAWSLFASVAIALVDNAAVVRNAVNATRARAETSARVPLQC
jgi:hypothetical protein